MLGLEPGTLDWLGPLDPSTDPLWQELMSGNGVNEREYWARRAADVGRAGGRPELDTRGYMSILYNPPGPELVRPQAVTVADAARAADIGVSVLTNDLSAFHGPQWAAGIDFLHHIDHLVDCSDTGILKPDHRAFQRAVDVVDAPVDRILFVDDQPANVEGARSFGLTTIWFDVANAADSWDRVARQLDL